MGRGLAIRLALLVLAAGMAPLGADSEAQAAPITGSGAATAPGAGVEPAEPETSGDGEAVVLEFSVLETEAGEQETTVLVRQAGGGRVCVVHSATDVITRAYRPRGDEPFQPEIPSVIQGETSGNRGLLVGFNETRLFIRPEDPAQSFAIAEECFTAGPAQGCFIPKDDDCDQWLDEGESACAAAAISQTGCSLAQHADLTRFMRILLALNQPLGDAPIITAADFTAPSQGMLPSGFQGRPSGAGGLGGGTPVFGGVSGGSDFVTVPSVIGLLLDAAQGRLFANSLALGTVATAGIDGAGCQPGSVVEQGPAAGTSVLPGSSVSLLLCPQVTAVPEPGTLILFALGLVLLGLAAGLRRPSA